MSVRADEELIYAFDPLCGWCFAFVPTMAAAVAANPDLPVRLLYGGLVVGERVGPIAGHRDYLLRGFEQVRAVSGRAPGRAFLEGLLAQGSYISDSEPPCRAIWAMEQLAPAGAVAFASAMPDLHYIEGQPLDDVAILADLAAAHGADGAAFARLFDSDTAREGVQAAFTQARRAGALTYPTLTYRRGGRAVELARGYAAPDELLRRIDSVRAATPA